MEPILEVIHLSKIYVQGEVETRVLEDVNLRVFPGEYVALMGPSGSGKSTLLNVVSGLDAPTSGDVLVNGQSIVGLSESELATWRREHIGFIFQQYYLMPVLTAFENVELPLLLFDLTRRERKERVEAALAIVADPLILIGDEPTGNLDVHATEEVLRLFDTLNRDLGKTIIMVTHDPRAAEHARTIEHLDKGVLVHSDNRREIRPGDLRAKTH